MLFSKILDKLQLTLNPVKYGRKQGAIIGDNCKILCGGSFSFGSEPYLIELGNHVEITSGCRLITHDGGMWSLPSLMGGVFAEGKVHKYGRIVIGDNSYLGNNVIVLPGVTIGKNCVIGAGSVVTKSIPDNSVACGNPCRVIKTINEYAEKCLKENLDWDHENYKKNKKEEILRIYKGP